MKLTESERNTVAELYPMVLARANRYGFGIRREIARDAAVDALIYAVRKYQPGRGRSLNSYVTLAVNHNIWKRLRLDSRRVATERYVARPSGVRDKPRDTLRDVLDFAYMQRLVDKMVLL